MIEIKLIGAQAGLLGSAQSDGEAALYVDRPYQPGDVIRIESGGVDMRGRHLAIKLDQAVDWAMVYAPSGAMNYRIPTGDELPGYAPGAFGGARHVIRARLMSAEEIGARRNLAHNPADQRGDADAYPHATANVETRGEAVFAARNAIDGCTLNHSHGEWPFLSWGIGAREDACLTLEFGRTVAVDELRLVLRADFPHDAYWTRATVALSDGHEQEITLERTGQPQLVRLSEHRIDSLTLKQLIKSDEPSAYPALTQIEVYGKEVSP